MCPVWHQPQQQLLAQSQSDSKSFSENRGANPAFILKSFSWEHLEPSGSPSSCERAPFSKESECSQEMAGSGAVISAFIHSILSGHAGLSKRGL